MNYCGKNAVICTEFKDVFLLIFYIYCLLRKCIFLFCTHNLMLYFFDCVGSSLLNGSDCLINATLKFLQATSTTAKLASPLNPVQFQSPNKRVHRKEVGVTTPIIFLSFFS